MLTNQKNKLKKKKRGFTLIELIIVIAIMGVLAMIAIPRFLNIKTEANLKSDISNAKAISDATGSLIAKGDIAIPAAATTITLDAATAAASPAVTNEDKIETAIQGVPTGKGTGGTAALPVSHAGHNFKVTIDTNGGLVIMLDSENIYPKSAVTAGSPYAAID